MKITDQALRTSFLNDVAVNRELIKAWQEAEKLIGTEASRETVADASPCVSGGASLCPTAGIF